MLRYRLIETEVNPCDLLDACSLIWLLEKCPNPNATATALQAIAGLPRSFTAFHLLRKAGAIRLVLKEFRACFHRDSTLDSHCYVTNPENAEKYCRAWMRLTYNTAERWPVDLLKPLEALEVVDGPSHVRVIAACTRAIATLESRDGRSLILCYLERCTKDPLHFSHEMQCWLIDTFLQSSLVSKTCFRPKDHIVKEAIPILVYLLHFTKHAMASHVRSAVALSLSYLTHGSADKALFNNEDKRRDKFYELIIPSLSVIINDPADYGADETLLDLIGREFSRLTSLAFSPDHLAQRPKWHQLKPIAQRGLWKLYIDCRIKHLPHEVVADVLQIMYPPVALPRSEHPRFVKSLVRTIWSATEPQVMVGALRLLEPLFLNRHPAVLDVFIEGKGIAALLRVAHIGDTGRRRIQLDCIRNICLFVRVVTEYYSSDTSLSEAVKITKEERLDHIFQSDFFPTLNQIVVARRWWLPEVSEIWMPALVKLCEIRPGESVWRTVQPTLRNFAESNEGKHGCAQLMNDLESMQMFMAAVCDSSDSA